MFAHSLPRKLSLLVLKRRHEASPARERAPSRRGVGFVPCVDCRAPVDLVDLWPGEPVRCPEHSHHRN